MGHGTEQDKRGAQGLCPAVSPLPFHHALLSLSRGPIPPAQVSAWRPLPCHALA